MSTNISAKDSNSLLDSPIDYIKGIGPNKAELLKSELGIFTFRDLLFTFPFRHDDRSVIIPIKNVRDDGNAVQIKGILSKFSVSGPRYQKRIHATIADDSGTLSLVWFQGAQWLLDILKPGEEYLAYGKVTYSGYKFSMAHPEMELFSESKRLPGLEPVYSSTEKLNAKGLDSKARRKWISILFEKLRESDIPENLPDYLIRMQGHCSRIQALKWIHLPSNPLELNAAMDRLKFEELLFQQLRLLTSKVYRKKNIHGPLFKQVGEYFNGFYTNNLHFTLTDAQKRVIKEIRVDTGSGMQMNRLLQGDVGAGKTIVALMVMLLAIDNGFQACLMAPTEILAQQHYASLTKMLKGLGVPIALLTGSVKGNKRKEVLKHTLDGELKIVIGTHALLEDPVKFQRLGIAVIDEQHRFGVAQRANLWQKNEEVSPHILVMTATPIPRTLSMAFYGDLDISIIDQLPPGRKPIKTIHNYEVQRPQMIHFMRSQIELGRQIYVVYPLIEESEKLDLSDLNNGYEQLLAHFPRPTYQMSILHGRMKPDDKDHEMKLFAEGKTQILVATTVIEVGVDVPNASVMIIENAERFGLSQLHQLRGRVGRGADQSYCILMTGYKLSNQAKTRIHTMCETTDGFKIAEVDLELRGPGDIEGTRQSGSAEFKLINISQDIPLLEKVQPLVTKILDRDPELLHPANQLLRKQLHALDSANTNDWRKIS